jgi:predicted transcriptional regulator
MTTLDRLFKKGLLHREKKDRAFIYSATLSAGDLERRRAVDLVRRFFSGSQQRRDVLLSSLVDAVGQYDSEMLDELERKIRMAREHS